MEKVLLEIDGGTARIVISNPDKANCITLSMVQQMNDVCDTIDDDQTIGCAIVSGAEGTFCSGADRKLLAEVGSDPADSALFDQLGSVYEVFHRVRRLKVPTIAAVRGSAVGAGVNLMLSADTRVVAEDASILPGFQKLSLHPGGGHFSLLGRIASWEACVAAGVFGAEFSGADVARLGMAWRCVADDMVESTAAELAAVPAADPELSRHVIHALRTELSEPRMTIGAASDFERPFQMWSLRRSAATADAMAARGANR